MSGELITVKKFGALVITGALADLLPDIIERAGQKAVKRWL